LENITLQIQPAEFVGLTGPSGSGKSTLLNLAALLDVPSQGFIEIEHQRMDPQNEAQLSQYRRERIGMIFQRFHLLQDRSVLDNVLFRYRYTSCIPTDAIPRALETLDQLGLADLAPKKAGLLSGGEMQRVAVARAILTRPALLLADEPTGNLDEASGHDVMETLRHLNQQGVTILVATHNPAWLAYCTRHLTCQSRQVEDACVA